MATVNPVSRKTRVVVVGGGYGGAILAHELEKMHASSKLNADVTLIDKKEYFEHNIASLRALVQPDLTRRSTMKFSDFLRETNLVVGGAKEVSKTAVVLDDGREVPFDYLVVATGAQYAGFAHAAAGTQDVATTTDQRHAQATTVRDRLQAAKSVLIVGGGPVGVELAGEIAHYMPGKEITLVHSGKALLDSLTNARVGEYAREYLQERGVKVLLGDRVPAEQLSANIVGEGGTYRTLAGTEIHAEAVFTAFAGRANSSLLRTHFPDAIDSAGRVRVDKHLRVVGHDNVFAVGDVTDTKELKVAYLAGAHVGVVAANLRKLLSSREPAKAALNTYKPNKGTMMLVTLGPEHGVAQMPVIGFTKRGFITGLKKDLFVGRFRKQLGLRD